MDTTILLSQALKTLHPTDICAFAVGCFQNKIQDPFLLGKAIFLLEQQFPELRHDAKAHALAGSLRFQFGDYVQAQVYFQEARRLDPQLSLGDYLIHLHFLSGKPGKAGGSLKKILQDSAFAPLLFQQGKRFFYAQDWISAQNIFKQLVWANVNLPNLKNCLGRVLLKQGKSREALNHFAPLEKSGQRVWDVALALILEGEREKVQPLLQKMLESAQHPSAHYLFALWAEKKNDWIRMEGHLLNSLETFPDQPSVLLKMAEIQERNGKKQLSQKHQQRAFELLDQEKKFWEFPRFPEKRLTPETLPQKSGARLNLQDGYEALHNQGIFLYRQALDSQKTREWEQLFQFWKKQYLNPLYWQGCFARLQPFDTRFTPEKQAVFKQQVMTQIFWALGEGIRERLSLLERREWLEELLISPFSKEDIKLLSEACLSPVFAPIRLRLKNLRQRFSHTHDQRDACQILIQLEQELFPKIEQIEQLKQESSTEFEALLEEASDMACDLANRFLYDYKDYLQSQIALDLADCWGRTPSLQHRIQIGRKNLNEANPL